MISDGALGFDPLQPFIVPFGTMADASGDAVSPCFSTSVPSMAGVTLSFSWVYLDPAAAGFQPQISSGFAVTLTS